jgi:hypothetical protein
VLLYEKYTKLRHGHKKNRQEKGEEVCQEEQKVTFASFAHSYFKHRLQGRCFFIGNISCLEPTNELSW